MAYTIQKGDTLSKIAQANNTDVATLAKANNIKDVNKIFAGASLNIPTAMPPVQNPAPQSNAITTESLTPTPKIEVPPQLPPTPTTPQPSAVDNILKNYETTVTEDSAKTVWSNLIAKQFEAVTGLGGEAKALADENIKQGVNQKKQELQTLNSQILKKQAEIGQDDVQLVANMRAEERRDTLLPFAQMGQAKLAGDAQIVRALKNSEIGVLNALAIGKQGDIALAQETAKEAVDLKYAPYRDQIAIGKAQLEAIKPFLDAAEKKEASALELKTKLALKEIDKVSDFQKTALSNAILNKAPQSVISAINSAGTMEDILKVGKGFLVSPKDELELQKLRIGIAKDSADYAKTIGELNKARTQIGGTTGDITSDLILGSSAYSGKQPSAGWIDDFTQAGVALGNVKELQKLIDQQGGTGLVKGNIASLFGKFSSNYANASAINAQIQRTVPGLARGIFKEVGVLTDQDISNYKKTLPNLTSPEQQNKLALLATYDVIGRSMAISLANQAKAKNDVSGYYQDYNNVVSEVARLKSELGFVESAPITPENKAKLEGAWGASLSPQNITSTLDNLTK